MSPLLHLRIAGALLLLLAALHLAMPRRFHWKEELARLSLLNRQIFLVHTFFICLVLTMMGTLSLFGAGALMEPSPLARYVLAGLSTFWAIRLIVQWFVYDPKLWRGHPFNTGVHLLFTLLWSYLAWVYALAFLQQFRG